MEREPSSDAWDDIVRRLGDDVFADVPDVITTGPPSAQPAAALPTDFDMTSAMDPLEDFDAFIPPSPTLPTFSRRTRASWAAVIAGPVLLGCATVFGFADTWSSLIGMGLLAAGAVSLFTRMPNNPLPDDEDGAVV